MVVLPTQKKPILIMGGVARGMWALQDVWSCQDGTSWDCLTQSATWSARSGHAAVAVQAAVLLVGGVGRAGLSGDVWRSVDGVTWKEMVSLGPWPARYGHGLLLLGDALLLLAGVGLGRFLNDVWRSDDQGETWYALQSAPFAPRAAMAIAAVGRRILLAGGRGEDGCFQDLWLGEDIGLSWSQISQGLDRPLPHSGASMLWDDSSLLILGGFDGLHHQNAMWHGTFQKSVSWRKVSAPWAARYCHRAVVVDNVIVLTGGHGAEGAYGDTWTSPGIQLLRARARELCLLGQKMGLSQEIWEKGVLPYVVPSIALENGSQRCFRVGKRSQAFCCQQAVQAGAFVRVVCRILAVALIHSGRLRTPCRAGGVEPKPSPSTPRCGTSCHF